MGPILGPLTSPTRSAVPISFMAAEHTGGGNTVLEEEMFLIPG